MLENGRQHVCLLFSRVINIAVYFTEGTDVAVWDDYTNNTKLEFSEDCVSFTTRVSAR